MTNATIPEHDDLLSSLFYSRPDILSILGVSNMTLQRLEAKDEGPPKTVLPGRRVAYKKTSFQEWLLSREQPQRPPRRRRTGPKSA